MSGTIVLAGWLIAEVAGFGLPNMKNTDAAPIEDRLEPLRSVDTEPVDASQATAMSKADVPNVDAGTAAAAATGTEGSGNAEAVVEAALPDPSEMPSSSTGSHVPYKSLVELRAASMPDAAWAVSGISQANPEGMATPRFWHRLPRNSPAGNSLRRLLDTARRSQGPLCDGRAWQPSWPDLA